MQGGTPAGQQRAGEGGGRSGAWPRAAWFVRGQGRHAVDNMSDAPLILPLTPLGEFVARVGRRPRQDELVTYLARLREQARSRTLEFDPEHAAVTLAWG